METNIAYRGLFLVVGLVALGGVLFGFYGAYVSLTGGTGAVDDPSMLGEYQCDAFEGDPEMPHESDFVSPRTVVDDSYIASFNVSETDDGIRFEVVTDGPLINASASTVDGRPVTVRRYPDEDRIVIPDRDSTPFRLFIESVSSDTPVRTEIDICPPE